MQYDELSALSDEALVHRELQLERDLLELRFRLKTSQLENTSSVRKLRRDIARIRTAQRQREIAQGLSADTLRGRYRASFRPGQSAGAAGQGGASAGFLQGLSEKLGGEENQASE